MVGVDLQMLLGSHVSHGRGVPESLGLHDSLHVGRPTVLRGDNAAGRVDQSVGDDHLLHLLVEDVLHDLAQVLELGLVLLTLLLLLLVLGQLQTLLGDGDEVLAVELLELLHDVLVDGLGHVDDLEPALLQPLHEGGGRDDLAALAGDEVDVLLILLHPGNVVAERAGLVAGGRGVEAEEAGQLLPVGGVLVDAELEVLAELLVELLVTVLVLGEFVDQLHAFLDQVLADDLQDLVLLEHLTGNVERQVLGVDDALDEVQVLGDELLAVVHDEDAPDVQLDVVLLLLVLEQVEGSSLGNEEQGTEFELALHREVLHGQMFFPVVGEALVEFAVLFLRNVVGIPGPDGLGLVELLVLGVLFLQINKQNVHFRFTLSLEKA